MEGLKIKNPFRRKESVIGASGKLSTYMLITIIVTISVCVKLSLSLIQDRRLPADYNSIDSDIRLAATDVADLSTIAELSPVANSWDKIRATSAIHGFTIKPYGENDASQTQLYSGPLKSWSGVAQGNPQVVLRAIKRIQKSIPIFLYEYRLSNDVIYINFSVVGT